MKCPRYTVSVAAFGFGKSSLAVALSYNAHVKGRPVYSNLHSTSDQKIFQSQSGEHWANYLTPEGFVNLTDPNAVVLADEFYLWVESRMSGTRKKQLPLTYAILQSRKHGFDLIYTTQLLSSIDKRAKNLTGKLLIAVEFFTYELIDLSTFPPTSQVLEWENHDWVFDKFNTHEVVSVDEMVEAQEGKAYKRKPKAKSF